MQGFLENAAPDLGDPVSHARNLMSAYDRPGRRTTATFAAAPDIGRARYCLLVALPRAVSAGDRGHSRVRTSDAR